MPRRASTCLTFGVVALAGLLAACGLDENGLEAASLDSGAVPASTPVGDATASSGDGSGGTTGNDSSAPPPAGDATVPADATTPGDATTPDDAPPPPPPDANPADVEQPDVHILDPDAAYDDSGDPCDLDEDGYKATGGSCGGNDCCDYDSRANPGDTNYYPAADACGSFDYDCNGRNDPEYATVNCSLGFFQCTGSGFAQAPPACGAVATFDTCHDVVVACSQSQSQVAQGCR